MNNAKNLATRIYKNGTIIPMTGIDKVKEAVAVSGETILGTGSLDELEKYIGTETEFFDLDGKTMLPGFYDAHSHFAMVGTEKLLYINLSSPPIGNLTSIEDYISVLKAKAEELPEGTLIIGNAYDNDAVAEKRHPNRYDLDKISTKHPIILIHYSYHVMVGNSEMLRILKIDDNTPNPENGVIVRDDKGVATGVLEENAVLEYIWFNEKFNIFGLYEDKIKAIKEGSDYYASVGITTANEGGRVNFDMFEEAFSRGYINVRCVLWFDPEISSKDREEMNLNTNMITIGGTKAFQDGSIQCSTGYLTRPYYKIPEGQTEDYRGYPTNTREKLTDIVEQAHNDGLQIYIHGNGDAAIDDILYAYENAQKKNPRKDPRHVVIHAQTSRLDQLEKMKELGVIPSFFVASLYKNGDAFKDTYLGPDRIKHINPVKTALDMGIKATIHTDSPVMPPDPLLSMWVAVNRKTNNGNLVGESEKLSIYEALLTNTIYGAYQNKEENIKGTIETGKLADFVILEENPLQVSPDRLKDIKVLKTIVGDKIIYENK